jgi:hypothetical protein
MENSSYRCGNDHDAIGFVAVSTNGNVDISGYFGLPHFDLDITVFCIEGFHEIPGNTKMIVYNKRAFNYPSSHIRNISSSYIGKELYVFVFDGTSTSLQWTYLQIIKYDGSDIKFQYHDRGAVRNTHIEVTYQGKFYDGKEGNDIIIR